MMVLLSTLLGFITSAVPDIFKIFQDKRDKSHELEVMKIQAEVKAEAEIITKSYDFDIEALRATTEASKTGYKVVDIANGMVRPIIAYAFFFLYASVKVMNFIANGWISWSEEDMQIFAGIIAFYFGSRAMQKARK